MFRACILSAVLLLAGCHRVCESDWSMGCSASDPAPVENWWAGSGTTDVTFIAFADCQTDSGAPDKNDLNALAINGVDQGVTWPMDPFGFNAPVSHIRGVIMAGDITQHGRDGRCGTDDNIKEFTDIYGLCGNRAIKFPIFEGYGNHDFFSYDHLAYRIPKAHPAADSVALRNPYRAGLTNVAPGMDGHYSWEWDNIHFVQVNLCPSDVDPMLEVRGDRNPRNALTFLANDLAKFVRGTNKRVIIVSHYGFYDSWDFDGWWTPQEAQDYLDVISEYDVIAHIHGHAHNTQHYTWNGIHVFNVGSPYYATPNWNPDGRGHFAIFRITNDTLYTGDAAWNPSAPGTDIRFPARWTATIALK